MTAEPVTTNAFERTFLRDAGARWVSTEGPTGPCGVVDIATLQDGGGVRWTLTLRKVVSRKDAAECSTQPEETETLSWEHARQPFRCAFVQPGLLGR